MRIDVHPSLQRFNDGMPHIDIDACTVSMLLESIGKHNPALKSVLMDERHQRQPYVNIYINNQSMDDLDGQHRLSAKDSVVIMSALVGG